MRGFLFGLTNDVHYNGCFLGVYEDQTFYFDQDHLNVLLRNIPSPVAEKLFDNLNHTYPLISKAKKQVNSDTSGAHTGIAPSCFAGAAKKDFTSTVNIYMEYGRLDKWNSRRTNGMYLGDLSDSKHQEPSLRDLRMADNNYETLRQLPKQDVALILSGRAHTDRLVPLLEDWQTQKSYYLLDMN